MVLVRDLGVSRGHQSDDEDQDEDDEEEVKDDTDDNKEAEANVITKHNLALIYTKKCIITRKKGVGTKCKQIVRKNKVFETYVLVAHEYCTYLGLMTLSSTLGVLPIGQENKFFFLPSNFL